MPSSSSDRNYRRKVMAIAAAIVLVLAGGITATTIALSYAHTAGLTNDGGGYGWTPPDDLSTHFVDLGPYHGLVTAWRPGKRQAFFVDLTNNSSVTQTILGIADESHLHEQLDVSAPGQWDTVDVRYEPSLPVSIAPHETRLVRYSLLSPSCAGGRRFSWDQIRLRVRVGWFTRTETVRLSTTVFEMVGSPGPC